jgi:carboxymethylenebutenolidase
MPTLSTAVTTSGGNCPVTLHTPDGPGPWPGVIMYPDAGGFREALNQMAARLAGFGYAVLLPDMYYRHGDWKPFTMTTVFSDPDARDRLMTMAASVTADIYASDTAAFLEFLERRPEVKGDKFGVCGYCMGGRAALIVAGRHPDRVAAAASFHGGGLATDQPTSPHLLADRIRATVLVAAAQEDATFPVEQAELLDKTLTAAGVDHKIEFYPAAHGFAVPDSSSYDAQAAERHWLALRDLFGATLSG